MATPRKVISLAILGPKLGLYKYCEFYHLSEMQEAKSLTKCLDLIALPNCLSQPELTD